MKYSDLITAADKVKALFLLGIEGETSGRLQNLPGETDQVVPIFYGNTKKYLNIPDAYFIWGYYCKFSIK